MMKTIRVISIAIICLASTMVTKAQESTVEFAIYETVQLNELRPFSENLSGYILKQDLKMDSPVLGYISTNENSIIDSLFTEEETNFEIRIMLTRVNPSSRESHAIIALHMNPVIVNSDIQKSVPQDGSVKILFTNKGSKKWSKMTKQNTGKRVAFVINDEIWSLPLVNDRIKSGLALISGIESREKAIEISDMINSSLQD